MRFSRTDVESLSGPVTSRKPGEEPRVIEQRLASLQQRKRIYQRDAGQCQYCGIDVAFFEAEIDHVHPWARRGPTKVPNMVLACKPCNQLKRAQVIPRELQPDTRHAVTSLWRKLSDECSWPIEASEKHRLHIWDFKHPTRKKKR